MAIHLSGSVAYDRIMTFPGRFTDHILPEKLQMLNVSFLLDRLEEKRGGTAGNIAYSLALLGEKPMLYASVGKDFTTYAQAFAALGLPLDKIRILEDNYTASAYITTDQKNNQITSFNPGAMSVPCAPDLYPRPGLGDWAVVSPGNLDDMRSLPELYRSGGIPFIYDPGQQVLNLDADFLQAGMQGAEILIVNAYELEMLKEKCGINREDLLEKIHVLITTFGEDGSEIQALSLSAPVWIKAVPTGQLADPTGAGDAYRAGLVKGLHAGLDFVQAARLGAVCASFCVEKFGTQEHVFTQTAFARRHQDAFGEKMPLAW